MNSIFRLPNARAVWSVQPGKHAMAAFLGLAGLTFGQLPAPVAAQGFIPKLQQVQPTLLGDAYFQRETRAKSASPSSYAFPDTAVGSESVAIFTLTNTEAYGGSLIVNGPPSISGAGFTAQASSAVCSGGTLAAGASCQVVVKFKPTASNYYYGQLNFDTTPPTSSVFIEGNGVPLIMPSITPNGLEFGSQPSNTESATQRVTIANNASGGYLEIKSILVTPPFEGIFCNPAAEAMEAKRLGPVCSGGYYGGGSETSPPAEVPKGAGLYDRGPCREGNFTLYSGEFCHVDVVFLPQGTGRFTGSLIVRGGFGQEGSIPLVGTSGPRQAVTTRPEVLSFGEVILRRSSGPLSFSLSNTGIESLKVNSISVVPPRGIPLMSSTVKAAAAAADYALTHNCGTLQPTAGCAAEVTFTPSELGSRPAEVMIEGTFEGSPKYVPLSGSGLALPFPVLTYSISSLAFGRTPAGSGASETFNIANSGQLPVRFNQLYVRGDFTLTHDCPALLPAGQTCRVTVTYRASIPGSSLGEIVIESDAQETSRTIPISGSSCRPASLRGRGGLAGC
jgi:hypothetical protein